MRVLLISYWFPPSSVIGSKRWGEFYQLSTLDKSISFTVLTANWKGDKIDDKNIHYIGDEVEYIPPKSINKSFSYIDVLKHPTIAIRSIDKSIFLPWHKEVKGWIYKNQDEKFDIIIASFSPIASILLGNYAKKVYQLPYIVDLRDLISNQGQKLKIPVIDLIDKSLDKFITKDVNLFLTVSPTCNIKASNLYKKRVETVYNGLSKKIDSDCVDLSIKNINNIKILYMGTLGVNRNPKNILNIFNEYVKNNRNSKIEVRFASQDNPFEFINKTDIENIKIEWLGYLSKENLEEEKNRSDAFLLLEDKTSSGNENLTGKIFEYLYFEKPILISCHNQSDIVRLIEETNTGLLIENQNNFKDFLLNKRYMNIEKVNFYTRYNQFQLLKDILNNVVTTHLPIKTNKLQ